MVWAQKIETSISKHTKMDTKANCSDEALPDEDSSDEDLSAEENPATLLTRTPPTSLLKALIMETFQRNPLLIVCFIS